MGLLLPMMFPSFDDRIQEIESVQDTLIDIGTEFAKGEFPILELLEIGIPLVGNTDERNYSEKQLKAQRWVKENWRRSGKILANPSIPPIVKVPVALTVAFVAYGTGGRGPGMSTPEIQRYDESAFGAPGVGGYSII